MQLTDLQILNMAITKSEIYILCSTNWFCVIAKDYLQVERFSKQALFVGTLAIVVPTRQLMYIAFLCHINANG